MSKKGRQARLAAREVVKASERAAFSLNLPGVIEVEQPASVEPSRPAHPLQAFVLMAISKSGPIDPAGLAEVLRGAPAPTKAEQSAYRAVAVDVLCDLHVRGVVRKDHRGCYRMAAG